MNGTLKIGGIFFLVASLLCLGSCSKTGPAGPEGTQGPQGEPGPAGPVGITGADGSTIYNGSSVPSSDIGRNGDYYINKTAASLYGPKTDAGWGDPLSLKGTQGETGAPGQAGKDGSQILTGTSVPSSTSGNTGDYYWNTANYLLYGPKTASGWGSGIALRGPKGDKGDPGNVNVRYSDWVKFNWSSSHSNEDIMEIHEPSITLDFINNGGTILSYLLVLQTTGTDTVIAKMYSIPQSISSIDIGFGATGDKFDFNVAYDAMASKIRIDVTSEVTLPPNFMQDFLFNPDPINPAYNRYRYRYIVIPGEMHLRQSSPPPDPKDYQAICQYYGIPE